MYKEISTNYVEEFEKALIVFGGESRGNKKYVLRKNVGADAFTSGGAYFGCIAEGEAPSGSYSDLSIVVFPSDEANTSDDRWLITLTVGSLGFKNDYQVVSLPGTKRRFLKCIGKNGYIKNDFLDIESEDGIKSFFDEIPSSLTNAIKNYYKVILSASLIDPTDDGNSILIIKKYLALYAELRNWPSNKNTRDLVSKAVSNSSKTDINDKKAEIKTILENRKYLVLQGAPGTGKTYTAKEIAKEDYESSNVFFTQFHAETSYSDFVYGIVPDTSSKSLIYTDRKGIFVKAIEHALSVQKDNKKVLLIIDEINRANLSNVLGPAFYLFEPTMSDGDIKIELCPDLSITKLPENLYVIATMNTADRSLAVVDFALRRRFAWITLHAEPINPSEGFNFCEEQFNAISSIFEKYASDDELDLQPGPAYFIVRKEEEINQRLKYEVMPLIKEYLVNGLLPRSKDAFVNYFRNAIGEEMFN